MCSRQIGANFSQIGAKMKNSWVATTQFLPSQNWSRQGFRTPKLPLCSIIISNQQQPFLRFVCLVVGLKNRTIYSANAGEFNGDESHQIESESFKNHQLTKHPQNLPSWSPKALSQPFRDPFSDLPETRSQILKWTKDFSVFFSGESNSGMMVELPGPKGHYMKYQPKQTIYIIYITYIYICRYCICISNVILSMNQ